MAYLASYQHDIFVSYAHGIAGGGNSQSALARWSRRLMVDLEDQVLVPLGTEGRDRTFTYWMDPALGGNQLLTPALQKEINRSALLLVIMSEYFLASEHCLNEIEWFRQACKRRGESSDGRVFVVRALRTDEARWPLKLRDSAQHPLPGYRFSESVDKLAGWPITNTDYYNALDKLATDVIQQIRQLGASQVGQLELRQMKESEASSRSTPGNRTVFLGYLHDTLDEEREELHKRLGAAGIDILPPADVTLDDESSLRDALAEYLRRADSMMLIANEYRGTWPRDQPGGFLSLQIEEAKRQKIRCDIWLNIEDPARIRRQEYKNYIDQVSADAEANNETVQFANIQSFADHALRAPATRNAPGLLRGVICANRPQDEAIGRDVHETVLATLAELQQPSYIFDVDDPNEEQIKLAKLTQRVRDANTVVVVCFDQKWDWAIPFLSRLNSISHIRGHGKVRLFVAAPRNQHDGQFDARALGFSTIYCVDNTARELKELLRQAIQGEIMGGGGAPEHA